MTASDVPGSTGEDRLTVKLAAPMTSLSIAVAWTLLAVWRPTATFHLAPLLVTVGWSYVARFAAGRPLNWSGAAVAAVGGAAISLSTTVVLLLAGRLEGPTFWESSDAPLEIVLMTTLGVLWGLRVTTRRRGTRLLPNAEPEG